MSVFPRRSYETRHPSKIAKFNDKVNLIYKACFYFISAMGYNIISGVLAIFGSDSLLYAQ